MHRGFLVILFISGTLSVFFFRMSAKNVYPNYLYRNSLDISKHAITKADEKVSKKIIFLGSSGVSGSNIPAGSTVSDYLNTHFSQDTRSYNLGILEGTLIESFVYFKQALDYSPDVILLGLSPGTIPRLWASPIASHNLASIKKEIDPVLLDFIKSEAKKKMYLDSFIQRFWEKLPPLDALIRYRGFFNFLRYKAYGELSDKQFYGSVKQDITGIYNESNPQLKILRKILEICTKEKIKLIVYLEPIFEPEKAFGNKFDAYRNFIIEYSKNLGVKVIDYTSKIPYEKKYFVDYVHLKPLGYKFLASEIFKDLEGELD